ncbi:PASTA domain-containing protein, partial [Longimicrobium sp.]|uniref:PASTA domain-containing protein n=1 Tax=Longimicrobium sp. TaxID=2029185 RepID=UPI002F95DE2D
DRRSLLATRLPAQSPARAAGTRRADPPPSGSEGVYVFVSTDNVGRAVDERPGAPVAMPDLSGLPLRDAARRLHALGVRVRVRGGGFVASTRPAAGQPVARGDTLVIVGDSR